MTHRLPRRVGLSMTKIIDRINTQSDGIVAQWSTLDDHDKAISDLWDECARIEQATASRVNNRHTETTADLLARVRDLDHECPAIAAVHDLQQRVTHLEEEQVSDLLARVRDLELVVATEAKPRELTPEEAERDNRLRIMLDDIRRESQRRQQAAQESQEQAPAPGLAPEDTGTATPRLTQRQRLVRADWALVWAQRHEGDRRRHDVVVALDWLREWADEAGIDTRQAIQAVAWMIPATDTDADRDWRLSEARRQIKQQLEDPSRNPYPVPVAIGLLTMLEPEPEPEPEPQATPDPPDPADLLTLALEQVQEARDGDCDREHVRQALDLLRQWQDATGVKARHLVLLVGEKGQQPAQQLSAAAWSIEYGLRWAGHERETWVALAIARLERWQAQQPDDDVISAEILDADAAAEMPTLPPDPTPTQRAGEVIYCLALAMIEERGARRHWVKEARRALQGWPGVEPDSALTISAGMDADMLLAAVHHVTAAATRLDAPIAPWAASPWHGAHAIACLDELLRREAQA